MSQDTCLHGCGSPVFARGQCRKSYLKDLADRKAGLPDDASLRRGPARAASIEVACGAGCGEKFLVAGKRRATVEAGRPVYCSRICQQAGESVDLTCSRPGCDVAFRRLRTYVEKCKSGRMFCSEDCRNAVSIRQTTGQHTPCEICQKPFWTKRSEVGKHRFCSVPCKDAWQARNRTPRACDHCGTMYERSPAVAGRFCSKPCESGYKTANARGYVNDDGYRMISQGGNASSRGEHILIVERLLGRALRPGENVHHRSGCRSDNRVNGPLKLDGDGRLTSGNLSLWSTAQPAGQEIGPKLDWAAEMIELYGQAWLPALAGHPLRDVLVGWAGALLDTYGADTPAAPVPPAPAAVGVTLPA